LRAGPGAPVARLTVDRLLVFRYARTVAAHRVATTLVATVTALSAAPVASARAQRVLTVVARDTALDASPTVPAGITTIRLQLAKGAVRRDLTVHRIPAGTPPDVVARAAAGRPEKWFEQWSFGGPAMPRDSAPDAAATIDLRPGRYALVSYEVDAAGRPRADRYLWRDFTAIAAAVLIPARFSVPDAMIKVKDARMEVVGTLRSGQRTLQIENAGARAHDVMFGRLKPGKTIDDVLRWDRDRNDPPPFVYLGGLTPMSAGVIAQTRLVLQTGLHIAFCTTRHASERDRDYKRGVIATFKVN
jgi:hypothetical protein